MKAFSSYECVRFESLLYYITSVAQSGFARTNLTVLRGFWQNISAGPPVSYSRRTPHSRCTPGENTYIVELEVRVVE